jgi:hypothetical protein
MRLNKEKLQKQIDEAMREIQVEAHHYSYPVFISDCKDKPDLIASSVVINIEGNTFLVTASHVLKEVLNVGSSFFIGVNEKYVQLEGEFVFSEHDEKDHFDIAFIKLSDEFIKQNGIAALDESKLVTHDHFGSIHIALLHGFPNSKNKQTKALRGSNSFKVKPFAYGGVIQKDFEHWDCIKKTSATHTCMGYSKNKDNNKPISPSGFSGGGVWVLPSINNIDELYLDSILIEYHKSHDVTVSTKIDSVVSFIKHNT